MWREQRIAPCQHASTIRLFADTFRRVFATVAFLDKLWRDAACGSPSLCPLWRFAFNSCAGHCHARHGAATAEQRGARSSRALTVTPAQQPADGITSPASIKHSRLHLVSSRAPYAQHLPLPLRLRVCFDVLSCLACVATRLASRMAGLLFVLATLR